MCSEESGLQSRAAAIGIEDVLGPPNDAVLQLLRADDAGIRAQTNQIPAEPLVLAGRTSEGQEPAGIVRQDEAAKVRLRLHLQDAALGETQRDLWVRRV